MLRSQRRFELAYTALKCDGLSLTRSTCCLSWCIACSLAACLLLLCGHAKRLGAPAEEKVLGTCLGSCTICHVICHGPVSYVMTLCLTMPITHVPITHVLIRHVPITDVHVGKGEPRTQAPKQRCIV